MTNQTQVSVQANTFRPRDYNVFGGLDVDHHSIAATFTDHDGLMQSLRLLYSAWQLLNYVRKHYPEQRLAFVYEAGPTGFGLYDELVANHHTCLVVAPPMVPTAPGKRVKTNRLDSIKLSTALRGGELKSIHVPTPKYRELRHLVQLRDTHVGQLNATKCRIKALLLPNEVNKEVNYVIIRTVSFEWQPTRRPSVGDCGDSFCCAVPCWSLSGNSVRWTAVLPWAVGVG